MGSRPNKYAMTLNEIKNDYDQVFSYYFTLNDNGEDEKLTWKAGQMVHLVAPGMYIHCLETC